MMTNIFCSRYNNKFNTMSKGLMRALTRGKPCVTI